MHGVILAELKKYVDSKVGGGGWDTLLASAGLTGRLYLPIKVYPDEDMVRLVAEASNSTGTPVPGLLEDFGVVVAPDLLRMYQSLIRPEWRTLDVLENVEETIHRTVRARKPGADPPHLKTTRSGPHQVEIVYTSPRKMCAVGRGIIQGVAQHYGERVVINEGSCMTRGGNLCRIVVSAA